MKVCKLQKSDFYVGQDVFLLQMRWCYNLCNTTADIIPGRVECIGRKYLVVKTSSKNEYKFDISNNFKQVSGQLSVMLFIDETDIYDWINIGRPIPREVLSIIRQLENGVSLTCLKDIQEVIDWYSSHEKGNRAV